MSGYMTSPPEDFGKGARIGTTYLDCELCHGKTMYEDEPLFPWGGAVVKDCPLCKMRAELERVKAELERVSKTLNEEIDRQVKRAEKAEAAEMERAEDVAALQFIFNVETNKLAKAEEDLKKLKLEFDNRRLTIAG